MSYVTGVDKKEYGSASNRSSSYDDSLEVQKAIEWLTELYPDSEVIEKPYGEYGIDVLVRHNGKDFLWVELERSMGWNGAFRYPTVSFLERKYHFVEDASQHGAQFMMVWFENNHNQLVFTLGDRIDQYEPFDKTLRSGRVDRVRHIGVGDCTFVRF